MNELDDRVEALRQKILAMPPFDYCGHFSSDINGNCMQCARENERREDMARAWDEGFATAQKWNAAPMCANPYRSA